MLKSKTIHRIYVKGEKGFPLQATCFPVGERRAAPFRGSPVSLSHRSQVAFHSINLAKVQVKVFTPLLWRGVVTHHFSTLKIRSYLLQNG
ncbi:hypothetical protein CRI88_06440 [Lysinibacillus fusiformis]|uniref:Uncharacterized protein n=1 Tax=Lysinibacillus fusiformis TaxID=28031 RepID=A0A2I0V135_9BACI|nr:hypothetical protein CRI88_06440 [Lysinibacillus fusiformis]